MKERQAGGAARSGRYRAHDSARINCLGTVVEPRLRMGILPARYDEIMLFEYPGPKEISGPVRQHASTTVS